MLKGEKIYLRALEPEDVEHLYIWENDPKEWHYSNTIEPFSRELLTQYVLNADQDIYSVKQVRMMIVEIENGKTIGCVDLFDFSPIHKRAGIGILIIESARKKGLATDTLAVIEKYAINVLQLKQLFANIGAENKKSIKLFEKAGYKPIGNKKDWLKKSDGFEDEWMYQKIFW